MALTSRHIRSYVVRAGRMGPGQVRALAELAPRYVLPYRAELTEFKSAFGRDAPLVLEIGFGMGDATAQIAAAQLERDFLAIEVHPPGVGALLQRLDSEALSNVRIVQHDAVDVITTMIAPASLAAVHIYFPDPWHKLKHNKRRLIQPPFVSLLASRISPGGYLHLATDWEPYAVQMLEVLAAEATFVNTVDGFAQKPVHRPLTKFEKRGLARGHGVWDLMFVKR